MEAPREGVILTQHHVLLWRRGVFLYCKKILICYKTIRTMNYKEFKNLGYRAYRLLHPENEPEAKFARHWERLNINDNEETNDLLIGILSAGDATFSLEKEDRPFVATVAQWLGSDMGFYFISEVLRSFNVSLSHPLSEKTLPDIFLEEWKKKDTHPTNSKRGFFLKSLCDAAQEGLNGEPSGSRQKVTEHTVICADRFISWLGSEEGVAFFMGAQVTNDLKEFF